MYSISKLTISSKIPTFQLGEVLALFWSHHNPKGLRRDRFLMYLIFIHSWTDCPSLFFVQLWCTRVSSETCRQSFKDCTLEQLGAFSLLPLQRFIQTCLDKPLVYISTISFSFLSPESASLQVSFCDAASERVQQILSGDAEPFNYCPKLVELVLGYTKDWILFWFNAVLIHHIFFRSQTH